LRTFFISDIHGNFYVFKKLFDHIKFIPGNDVQYAGRDYFTSIRGKIIGSANKLLYFCYKRM
jgi:hypothetical protein